MKTKSDPDTHHHETIVDQFTRQAGAFAAVPAHSNEEAFEILFTLARFQAADTVLDVGCGPGLVACAVAPRVDRVTGVDLTPAMLDQARQYQRSKGLANLSWQVGDIQKLPFADESFSCVLTRYTFHHLTDPQAVFNEMHRVTRRGGRVIVIDVAPEPAKRAAYDFTEKLRDPSHTRALTLDELTRLGSQAGCSRPEIRLYGLTMNLDELLESSFPEPGNRQELYRRFEADLGRDQLGYGVQRLGGTTQIRFPTAALMWSK